MKLRVMGTVYATRNPVDFENLLVDKPTRTKVIKEGKDDNGRDLLRIDVVAVDNAHAQGFYNQAKAIMTEGKMHIHECLHKEYGEPEDRPCVILEEVEL